jgi:hypothetical protein
MTDEQDRREYLYSEIARLKAENAALLARIEAGDRAREILHEITEAYKASGTPDVFGCRVNDILCRYYAWEEEIP